MLFNAASKPEFQLFKKMFLFFDQLDLKRYKEIEFDLKVFNTTDLTFKGKVASTNKSQGLSS